jgi:hypothetical protein
MQPMDETRYQKVYQDGVATGSKPDKAAPPFPLLPWTQLVPNGEQARQSIRL